MSARPLHQESVILDRSEAWVTLHVTSPTVVDFLRSVDPAARVAEAQRLLDLGVETARRAAQRADEVALTDVKTSIKSVLDTVREEVAASLRQLTELTGTTSDRLATESNRFSESLEGALADLPTQVREAIAQATSDVELADVVAEVIAGDDSPIGRLEARISEGLDQVRASHDVALGAALQQVTAVAATLSGIKGAIEQRDRSPAGGADYEATIENALTVAASRWSDRVDDVRHIAGRGGSKKGDFVAEVANGTTPTRIAVEVKRVETGLSAVKAEALLEEVAEAHDAHAVLLVCAHPQGMPAGLRNGEALGMVGRRGLAVCVPPDGDADVLAVAYSLARTMAVAAANSGNRQHPDIDLDSARSAFEQANRRLRGLQDIERAITRTKNDLAGQIRQLERLRSDLMTDLQQAVDAITPPS